MCADERQGCLCLTRSCSNFIFLSAHSLKGVLRFAVAAAHAHDLLNRAAPCLLFFISLCLKCSGFALCLSHSYSLFDHAAPYLLSVMSLCPKYSCFSHFLPTLQAPYHHCACAADTARDQPYGCSCGHPRAFCPVLWAAPLHRERSGWRPAAPGGQHGESPYRKHAPDLRYYRLAREHGHL